MREPFHNVMKTAVRGADQAGGRVGLSRLARRSNHGVACRGLHCTPPRANECSRPEFEFNSLCKKRERRCVQGRRPRCGAWPCRSCCARSRRRRTRAHPSTPRSPRPGRGASAGRACAAASSCRGPSARPATRRCGCGRGILAGSAACCCAQARGSRCGWAGWPAPTARAGGARAGARACAPSSTGGESGRTGGCRRRSASPIFCWRAAGCGVCRPRSSPAGSRPGCSATRCCRRCAQAAVSVKPPRSTERA